MQSSNEPVVRFGDVVIDVPQRLVTWNGEPQHLEPQAFDLLVYLQTHRDRVVAKNELLDEIWGDQFVSESALTTRIKEIRRAVGDDGVRQAVVKNYRGHGYRFVATVGEPVGHRSNELLGRERDLAEVCRLLDTAGEVTLVGPGGVGKTSLARAVAARWADAAGADVVFVDLAPVHDPADVPHVLRREAEMEDAGHGEEDVLDAVADLDAVVIIDNCEHLMTAAARTVDEITRRAGRARVIATSRERLGVEHEQVWPVGPLDSNAAHQLLMARARAIDPAYSPRSEDEPAIARLLAMLDRLPLAIEMAAARLPAMRADDLVDHLTGRLDLIRAPHRDVAERQRTLPALISWSENLLTPVTADLLHRLSVFSGPATATDIAAVVDQEAATLALGPLEELVNCSLAVTEVSGQATRYQLLETVRSIVADRRDPSIDERHARHYARVADDADGVLRTPNEAEAARRIDEMATELRAAHAWARRHDPALAAGITTSLLHFAQERQWPEPASWAAPLIDSTEVPVAPFAAAVAADASNRGDYELARHLAERALDGSDPRVRASAHDTLANIGIYCGDLALARHHADELYALGRESGDATTWALGLLGVVLSRLYGGDGDGARSLLEGQLRLPHLSPTALAWLEYGEGEVLASAGREHDAIERFDRAIAFGESVASSFVVGVARVSALAARSRAGEVEEALSAFTAVLGEYRRTRSLTHAATALRNLVGLMVRAGWDEPAMVLLGALDSPGTKSTYGVESEQMGEARSDVESRHDTTTVGGWLRHGTGRDVLWSLDYAIRALEEE